ncbi:hypothetical protein KRMM14A1004_17920 [Krasilnikovia sp. MM14-A1004]
MLTDISGSVAFRWCVNVMHASKLKQTSWSSSPSSIVFGPNEYACIRRNGMGLVIAVVAALAVGFVVGLLAFKVKQQWCPACGATLRCPTHGEGVQVWSSKR